MASRQDGWPPLELCPCSLVTARLAAPAWASKCPLTTPHPQLTRRYRGKLMPRAPGTTTSLNKTP